MKQDTIVALATAPIISAIGVIRVSGDDAYAIVQKIFEKPILEQPGNTVRIGHLTDESGEAVDEAVLTCFRAPKSYTGEDTIEISCHGSPAVLNRVCTMLIRHGARRAANGEFTRRAFLNGKLDLTQAEAVIDLIESDSVAESRNALRHLKGHLSAQIDGIREKLTAIAAQILAFIDYPDDEIADVSSETLANAITDASEDLDRLLKTCQSGRLLKEGVRTVIVGKPNVGKSSFMNLLSGFEKSIVTDIAGTTRDIVEETVLFADTKLILSDTAGIRKTDDTVESIGVERALECMKQADLIFCLFDGSSLPTEEDRNLMQQVFACEGKKIALFNKKDLGSVWSEADGFDASIPFSAKENDGLECFEETVRKMFESGSLSSETELITNLRHQQCLVSARNALDHGLAHLEMTADAILIDVEDAIQALGEMTGETVSDQILNHIFSRFCVGK